jgi:hypothetical protein
MCKFLRFSFIIQVTIIWPIRYLRKLCPRKYVSETCLSFFIYITTTEILGTFDESPSVLEKTLPSSQNNEYFCFLSVSTNRNELMMFVSVVGCVWFDDLIEIHEFSSPKNEMNARFSFSMLDVCLFCFLTCVPPWLFVIRGLVYCVWRKCTTRREGHTTVVWCLP